jgi:hypothetical protein
MRLCAFPFPESVQPFIAEHDKVFVVEQNRDAQMRAMLINELDVNPAKLVGCCTTTVRRSLRVSLFVHIHESVQKERRSC